MNARLRPLRGQSIRQLAGSGLLLTASVLAASATASSQAGNSYSFGQLAVGTPVTVAVKVTATSAGAVKTVEVLTLGAPGLDFQQASGPFTCEQASLTAGASCQQSVTFSPIAPSLRMGAVVLLDGNRNVLATAFLSGVGIGGLGVFSGENIIPIAGNGNYLGAIADGGPAIDAELNHPSSVAVDGAGNLYIADKYHHRIRMVAASTGIITTIAGSDNPAYTGDGSPAIDATLNTPWAVALDGAGNLYITDTGNNAVRMVAASTGIITTVAGNGAGCSTQSNTVGDGCPATSALLNNPQGATLDGAGNLYIADTYNHRIRMVNGASGIIGTIAGNGFTNTSGSGGYAGDGGNATQAELNFPFAVAFDGGGNMYIPDSGNNVVRIVNTAGIISTIAGSGTAGYSGDGAAAGAAQLWAPSGVQVDPRGNVYIADTQNNCIRLVTAATGLISTVAKDNVNQSFFDGDFTSVSINGPIGLFLDSNANLYFADTLNMRIREMQSNLIALDIGGYPIRQGDQSQTFYQTIENIGNAPLDFNSIVPDQNSTVDPAVSTCTAGSLLPVDGNCTLGVIFAPSVAGNPLVANVNVNSASSNSPLHVELVGDGSASDSTTVTLTSSLNPANFGQAVTLTANVTTGKTAGTPSGMVMFLDGVKELSTVELNTAAVATYTTSALAVGLHSLTASYGGDPIHLNSKSTDNSTPALTQTVLEATATSLRSAPNPAPSGQNVTFTSTVTAPWGGAVTPDGTVTFNDGPTALGTVALSNTAIAAFTTTTPLTNGTHLITATYSGDLNKQVMASTSGTINQEMQGSSTSQVAVSGAQGYANPIAVFGNSLTFLATVTGTGATAATGAVVFLDGTTQIGAAYLAGSTGQASFVTSTLAVGPHTISISYHGDANYGPSTSPSIELTVNPAQTVVTIIAATNPAVAGIPVSLVATVSLLTGISTPTGTVTFTDGTTTLGKASIDNSGSAAVNPVLNPGQHSITATYAGDANNDASASAALSVTVVQATTATAITSNPNPALVNSAVTFTAKVTGNGGTPSGTVTIYSNGTNRLANATLDSTGTAAVACPGFSSGSFPITAVYSGDANNSASTSPAITQVVAVISTVTDLAASTTGGASPQSILVATVIGASGPTPTGTVTFNNGSAMVSSVPLDGNGVAVLTPDLAAGAYTISAAYSGDASHNGSSSLPVAIAITGSTTASGFGLAVTPLSLTMAAAQHGTVNVALNSVSGFTDTIGLGCASLPAAVTCHFSTGNVSLQANALQTVTLTIDTNIPLTGGSSATNTYANKHATLLAGLFMPFSALLGWACWRFRSRNTLMATMILVLIISGAAVLLNGCSPLTQISATPGTYSLEVTGSGIKSNVTRSQSITLIITP